GGFGGAPKFPHPMDLRLLLRTAKRFGTAEALEVAQLTLDKMAAGGIYDHLGGGFHRYSTDARWLVPHFEKMLYDNALLVTAYVEAFQVTHEPRYAAVVRETLDYVLREMTDATGGFYSTQDADSEGEEGKFFVWSEDEVIAVLGPEKARIFSYCYDVTPQGSWEGHNILNRVKTHAQAAKMLGLSESDLAATLAECGRQLFAIREKRVHPGRDDKILAGWNGLMISAMAQAGSVLGEARFTSAAVRAADFVLSQMRGPDGQLLHTFKDGTARLNAYLDDYAPLIESLLDVYQATFEAKYVDAALNLAEDMIARFGDRDGGGFFYTPHDHEPLLSRNKDLHDNATPSGNATAAGALLRLGELCGRSDMEDWAHRTLTLLSGEMARVSMAAGQALIVLDAFLGPAYELVIAEGSSRDESDKVVRSIHRCFLPVKVIARRTAGADDSNLPASVRSLLEGRPAIDAKATLYVCQRGVCQTPVAGLPAIQALLQNL
ncbi:MAG TPA: thioredoxin domain-containing protein, partial [Planctomycetaceae bacterium]|nr:thioredoxin domain-containing protein [Planctomycetaceae bacterium]